MTDKRIKEETDVFLKTKQDYSSICKVYGQADNALLAMGFQCGIRTGERLGKIEVLEELREYINYGHRNPDCIIHHLSQRINELKEAQS